MSPQHEEAYKAIAYLYAALKEEELLREWVHRRSLDSTISDEKRAEAFIVLASKDWDCSFKITELPTSKETTIKRQRAKVEYIKPKDEAEFETARKCAIRGLNMIDTAITLAPDSESAWSYKVHLLSELSKLAEMDKDRQLKRDYERQIDTARSTRETIIKSQKSSPSP